MMYDKTQSKYEKRNLKISGAKKNSKIEDQTPGPEFYIQVLEIYIDFESIFPLSLPLF